MAYKNVSQMMNPSIFINILIQHNLTHNKAWWYEKLVVWQWLGIHTKEYLLCRGEGA